MTEWQPIDTAPLDGTEVDLWMTDEQGDGWRETDAWYVRDYEEEFIVYDGLGGHSYKRERRDGWLAPGHDYGDSGFCDQPVRNYGRPLAPTWKKPTHWMPRPDAP